MMMEMTGPVLVFGGPYGNLQATMAMKAEAERLRIEPDHCLCTGDVVAYCAQPQETVQFIRDWGVPVVMGNCEQALALNNDTCGCGFADGSTCDLLSKHWFAFANANLDTDSRAWMGDRPPILRFKMAGKTVVAIHGGVDDISRFIFASTPEAVKIEQATAVQADVILAGHCGLPFTQSLSNGVIWHNAGAIGMPANDGTPDVWYSVLTPQSDKIFFTHHRLTYDHQGAALRL